MVFPFFQKFKGHWAYLEFVDRGVDAYIEIDQVRFADSVIGRVSDSKLSFLLSNNVDADNLPEFIDDFVQKSIKRITAVELTTEEYSFLNYLYSEGLIQLEEQNPLLESLSHAKLVDAQTPPERYVLAMGKGSPYKGNAYVRGSPHSLGESVTSRNLSALGGKPGDRLDLANQLVSSGNPLFQGSWPTESGFNSLDGESCQPLMILVPWGKSQVTLNYWIG